MQRICGVDEAGRGPVIGSLVIVGALFYENQIKSLTEIGVKDSKLLSPVKRKVLFKEIEKLSLKYVVTKIKPFEIDQAVFKKGLNILEAKIMAEIIKELSPDVAYVDAPDVNEKRFGNNIKERINVPTNIVSEHHADSKYVVVGAASIIAKVLRDEEIKKLNIEHGFFGSGYCNDLKTINYLSNFLKEKQTLPDFVRKSWKTISKLR